MEFTFTQSADLVTVRQSLLRARSGFNDVDFDVASSMIDRVLATACSHGADRYLTAPDAATGRPLTTCHACGVSWYADFEERLRHVSPSE